MKFFTLFKSKMNEDQIIAHINGKYCGNNYYSNNNNSHQVCENIAKLITDNLSYINNYDRVYMALTSFLSKQSAYYYGGHTPCAGRPNIIATIKTLNKLISHNAISPEFVKYTIEKSQFWYIQLLIEDKIQLNDNILNVIIQKNNTTLNTQIESYVKNFTASNLNTAIEFSNNTILSKILNNKPDIKEEHVIRAIYGNCDFELIKSLITMGTGVNLNILKAACYARNELVVQLCINSKILPEKDIMKYVFGENPFPAITTNTRSYNSKFQTNIINILLNTGYALTYDDIKIATSHCYEFKNIEKYNIKFGQDFLKICTKAGYYPNYKHNLKPDVSCLEEECNKSGNLPTIKKLVKENNIKPNSACLQNACKFKSNVQTVRYLLDCGAKPDAMCLVNAIKSYGSSTGYLIAQEFEKIYNKENKTVKNDDNYEDNEIETEDNVHIAEPVVKEENNVIDEESSDEEEVPVPLIKKVAVLPDNDLSSEEEEVPKAKKGKVVVKKSKKKETKETDDTIETKTKIKDKKEVKEVKEVKFEKPIEEIKVSNKLPIIEKAYGARDIVIINKDIKKIFSIKETEEDKDKNITVSFLNLRKAFLTYLQTSNMLKDYVKNQYFTVPDDILKTIYLDKYENRYTLADIDNIVKNIIKNLAKKEEAVKTA